jgi:hypothetical protein
MAGTTSNWVTMVDPVTGEARDVHPADVEAAAARDWTVETPEQTKLRQYQETAGTLEGAKALGEGALSSATLGLSDVALSAIPGYSDSRQMREATFPTAAMAGQAAGFLIPGLGEVKALGTAGKVAKAVGAPAATASRAAVKAGSFAERLAAGATPGAARRVIAKGVGGAVGGAVEGGIIGAGQALTDASVRNKELTAELLLGHVRDGATIGGALGGGLGAGIEALAIGGRKVAVGAPRLLESMTGAKGVEGLAQTKALASFGALGSDFKRIVKEGGKDAPRRLGERILREEEAAFSGPGALGRAVRSGLEEHADIAGRVADREGEKLGNIYRTLTRRGEDVEASTIASNIERDVLADLRSSGFDPDKRIARSIERDLSDIFEPVQRADKYRVSSDLVVTFRESSGKVADLIRGKSSAAARIAIGELEADAKVMRKHFANSGQGFAIRELDNVVGNLRAAESQLAKGSTLGNRLVNYQSALDALTKKLEESALKNGVAKVTQEALWKLRRRIDKSINQWEFGKDPRADAYRKVRDSLKSHAEDAADRSSLGTEFREANAAYSDWVKIKKIAEQRAGMMAGNRSAGLTDTIVGAAGIAQGGLSGGVMAVVGPLGNKFLRSAAGDRTLATVANSYANWRKVTTAANDAAIKLSRDSRALVRASPVAAAPVGFSARLAEDFERRRDETISQQNDSERLVAQLSRQLAGVAEVSPELASATVQAGSRGAAYLAKLLPEAPGFADLDSVSTRDGFDAPESEKDAFLRAEKAVRKPTSVIGLAEAGELTPDEIDAVKTAYPSLYDAMRNSVVDEVASEAEAGRIPDYQRQAQLSMLTGIPFDATFRPDVIAFYQSIHDESSAPQPLQRLEQPQRQSRLAERRGAFTDREV